MKVLPRFLDVPRESFFLFGPRGTGKSTWIREVLPDALIIDLLRPEVYRELAARPERLRERVDGSPGCSAVVLDEVQRAPEVLNVVHEILEDRRHGRTRPRFVLTGSSARKLRRGGIDLLAGRAVMRTLHPFMAAELPGFRLEGALRHGLLPLVIASRTPQDTLAAYAALYLEQEVKVEGWARDAGTFARFLEVISFSHGSVLNLANVARECEVTRPTAAAYVEVLEDLLLAFRLPVFTRRARRDTSAHPKLYLFDTGVYRSLRPAALLDRPEEIEGAALEGMVAQHLRAWAAYSAAGDELYFWRTRSGVEVDFVVYGPSGLWAIQVQNSDQVRPADLRALRTFREDYPECTAVLLYRGADCRRVEEIWCLPVEAFLGNLRPGRGLFNTRTGLNGRRNTTRQR